MKADSLVESAFFMKRIPNILLLTIPILISVLLIWIIIQNGPELREEIPRVIRALLSLELESWELDHAVFGFCFGLPLGVIAILLKSFKKLSLWRFLLFNACFMLIQGLAIIVMGYAICETIDIGLGITYVVIPNIWFWNTVIITATFISFTTLFGLLFIQCYNERQESSETIDG